MLTDRNYRLKSCGTANLGRLKLTITTNKSNILPSKSDVSISELRCHQQVKNAISKNKQSFYWESNEIFLRDRILPVNEIKLQVIVLRRHTTIKNFNAPPYHISN